MCAVVVAVALLTITLNAPSKSSAPIAPNPNLPVAPVVVAPSVAVLAPGGVLLTHDATTATTGFGKGVLEVSATATAEQFRFISGAAPARGGRVEPSNSLLTGLPSNLPIVISFSTEKGPVSIFGRLAGAPRLEGQTITYSLSVYDAPGEGSTYTVSGQYRIPDELEDVRIVISGQTLAP